MTRKLPTQLVIATRESVLALWQAQHIKQQLAFFYPEIHISLLGMTTQGDRIPDSPSAPTGGKSLFVKELEGALQDRRADIAVHSMKDVPVDLPDGFCIAAICAREDPRDAFISNQYRSPGELPRGGIVGTSSLRRASQLRARYPDLEIRPLRGNVQTRLKKLDQNHYAAIVLAVAGLKRLDLTHRITAILDPGQNVPAAGQGALGVEALNSRQDICALVAPLNDLPTALCVTAERSFSRALGGNCQLPLGAHAQLNGGELTLCGFVSSADGSRFIQGEMRGDAAEAEHLGVELARNLIARGADKVLAEIQHG